MFDGTVRNVVSLQPGNFTIMFNNSMGRDILLVSCKYTLKQQHVVLDLHGKYSCVDRYLIMIDVD